MLLNFVHTRPAARLSHRRKHRLSATMVLSLAPTSLAQISRDAAAGDVINEYLDIRGIKTPATLALLSRDEAHLEQTLIQPLLQGWPRADGTAITVPDKDKPIAKAVLLHMWMMARQSWEATQLAAQAKTAPPPSTPSNAATAPTEDKVPRSLAPGRWTSLVQDYQSQQIDGQDRVFPVQELLGTETVIARVLHEHETSKSYTPVLLGELISIRTFQANGEPNPLAKRERNVTKLTLTGEQLVAAPEEPWQPRSVLAILDGLASIRWCYILCKLGTEQAVHAFFDWLVRLVRSRPQKTDQLAQFWMTVSWKLALEMRGGRTFTEATAVIMKDYDSFTECMSRESTQTAKKPAQPATTKVDTKGYGKGNTKSGKGTRPSPYSRPSKPGQWNKEESYDRTSTQWQGSQKQDDKQRWQKDGWSSDWKTQSK